jgi:hypothetical protein
MADIQSRAFDEWAQDIWPNGAILACSRPSCYFSERITTEQAASYLAHGWPTHCGRKMRVEQPAPATPSETRRAKGEKEEGCPCCRDLRTRHFHGDT